MCILLYKSFNLNFHFLLIPKISFFDLLKGIGGVGGSSTALWSRKVYISILRRVIQSSALGIRPRRVK
jgi:hypothetical protein